MMSDFLDSYSIQHWLECCPQAYLMDSEYGHLPGEREPEVVLQDPLIREQAIRTTVQLIAGERCALAASSGLIGAAPDHASKCFLATQTLDEARHVEVFTRRLQDLGVKKNEVEDVIAQLANPNLVKFAEVLLEKVDKKDFVAGVVGQNIILEGMAFSVFEMMQAANSEANPKFAHTLAGTIADERRHVGFGENRIGALIREHPERKADVERLQQEMSYYMLATFADQFRSSGMREEMKHAREIAPERQESRPATWHGVNLSEAEPAEIEAALADTVLAEFKLRLGRVGIDYQQPVRP
jgi:1,2-phenylacetyl-CoA epoxidase catalytic subunit